ncbi:rod shape-determining protein MreC [Nocardioides flavescens]|uniref:Cell shape-determining protein MreC n=1 Tax=Nocardioides flavescens TaxID=2691959 RepID=A0A6L7EW71_9ACTN|nr:rod shape-determining protein MreC [Nocardioides flavescens]MXG88229.1 rod shape-determining protein MreC [Nocardioides flavescens]
MSDRLNRRGSLEPHDPRRPRRSLVTALVLTSLALMAVDQVAGADGSSPVDPLRRAVGEVYGPVENAATTVVDPVAALPSWVRSRREMAADLASARSEADQLRAQLASDDYDRNRLQEYDDLTATAESLGYALVPARVTAMGSAQSFSRTVTIDAGARAGLAPDMTVVNGQGLVGRVLRVSATTATVLLVTDADSTVGGRVGSSMKVGFLHGRGDLGDGSRLDLELVDQTYVPKAGEPVVTWGSQDGAPYVSGVPIGTVESVYSSLRETTQRAVITPYVDFSALDQVGVVVPSGTTSDRAVIEVDGSLR